MRVSRRGELLERVLNTALNATIAFSRHPSRSAVGLYRALRDFHELQEFSDRQLRTVSRYVIDKKYITVSKNKAGDASITVTEAGKTIVARGAILLLKPKKQKVWDKKWRLVLFDIPTERKQARDRFAGVLKVLGFVHYQKSVFMCPYPCEEELEAVVDYLDIAEYVDLVIAERISREREFRSEFNLA